MSELKPHHLEVTVAPMRGWFGLFFTKTDALSPFSFYARVFAPLALGHFLSYVLRSINAVLAPTLISELSLDAQKIGFLTGAYFLAFAAAQLPIGMALDRFGPRRVQMTLLPVAMVGCLWFSVADSFSALLAARALTGLGMAGCFMGSLKAISDWRSPSRMPSMNGYLLAIGGLGAMASTLPVQIGAEMFGWRDLFVTLGLALAVTGMIIFLVTPELVHRSQSLAPPSLRSLLDVYRQPAFRRTIRLALIPHAAFFAVQGLWLGQWLDQAMALPHQMTGFYLFAGMVAMVIGTISIGRFTEWAASRGYRSLDVAAVGLWGFALIQLLLVVDGRPPALVIAVGFPFFGAFAGLEYAIVAQSVPPALAGRATTCLNLLVFSASFIVQAGFGVVLGLWGKSSTGAYPPAAFQAAFGLLLLLQAPGLLAWTLRAARTLPLEAQEG